MTRQLTLKAGVLSSFALFIMVVTVLVSGPAMAQVSGAGRLFRKPFFAQLDPNAGASNRLTILYNFTGGSDGGFPGSGGLLYLNGNLYGTATYNGDNYGLVFELSNPLNTGWIETPIFSLCSNSTSCNPYYAAGPQGLVADRFGNLYVTTELGNNGGYSSGMLFELKLSNGVWNPIWLYSPCCTPEASVILDAKGDLYGTLSRGGGENPNVCGSVGCGSVYELSASQEYTTLHNFSGFDGGNPLSSLALHAGNLYGSASGGGRGGKGVVFEIRHSSGRWDEEILYTFCSLENCEDGANPLAGLIFDREGNVYGTTAYGGANGEGTIFKLTPSEQGWTETVLYSFCSQANCADGVHPAGLVFDKAANLYGTTCNYENISGTVFQLTPAGVLNVFADLPGCSLAPLILVDDTFYGTISTGGLYGAGAVFEVSMQPLTTTALTSSLNPSIYGQAVTWTATVTTSESTTPTGKVNFMWGDSGGTATLNASGVATLTRSRLGAGAFPLTAVYTGDLTHARSTSAVLNQVIQQTTSAATISSSQNPSTKGQAVTFTATITSPTVKATGPVTFMARKWVLGTVQLSGGKAEFTTSTLALGSTPITAIYYGDSNIAGSSASVTQRVQK